MWTEIQKLNQTGLETAGNMGIPNVVKCGNVKENCSMNYNLI